MWPDGYYTAPNDAALIWDLQLIKNSGFNMVRKHVKVEPDRWYIQLPKPSLHISTKYLISLIAALHCA